MKSLLETVIEAGPRCHDRRGAGTERGGDHSRAGAGTLGARSRQERRALMGNAADAVRERAGRTADRRLDRHRAADLAAASRSVGGDDGVHPVARSGGAPDGGPSHRSRPGEDRPPPAVAPGPEARAGRDLSRGVPGAFRAFDRREGTRTGDTPATERRHPPDDGPAHGPLADRSALAVLGPTFPDGDAAGRRRPTPPALHGRSATRAAHFGPPRARERAAVEPGRSVDDRVGGRARWLGGTILALVLLAGCAGEPPAVVEPGSDPAEARRQLAAAAQPGPVPFVLLRLEERPSEAEAAALAARGVSGLAVRFAPAAPSSGGRRLVVALDGLEEPAAICAGIARSASGADARTVFAAWCDGDRPVARVRLPAAVDRVQRERAIWRAVARLFPDDYAETYGWNLFGLRVTIGGSFGF